MFNRMIILIEQGRDNLKSNGVKAIHCVGLQS